VLGRTFGSGFTASNAGSSGFGIASSKLVAVQMASPEAEDLDLP
jgi:hypothetical protein